MDGTFVKALGTEIGILTATCRVDYAGDNVCMFCVFVVFVVFVRVVFVRLCLCLCLCLCLSQVCE